MAAVTLPDGVKVGHWTDPVARTGCTVVLCEAGAVACQQVPRRGIAAVDFQRLGYALFVHEHRPADGQQIG